MRLYSITNMYTAGIHAGIQTAHMVHRLMRKYKISGANEYKMVNAWADNHMTIIVVNGGYHKALIDVYNEIQLPANSLGLPFTKWHEGEEALNGAATSVGIIVPEHIYNAPGVTRSDRLGGPKPWDPLSENERAIWTIIKRYKLAT